MQYPWPLVALSWACLFACTGSIDWAADAMGAAEAAAKVAVAHLATLVPCTTADEGCARQFIARFGQRAYRRPLVDDEVTGLAKVYAAGSANGGFPHGIELV